MSNINTALNAFKENLELKILNNIIDGKFDTNAIPAYELELYNDILNIIKNGAGIIVGNDNSGTNELLTQIKQGIDLLNENLTINAAEEESEMKYTRVIQGLKLKPHADTDKFLIESGKAVFWRKGVSQDLDYVESPIQIPGLLQNGSVAYVFIDKNGTLSYKAAVPDIEDLDDTIPVGAITSLDGGQTISQVIPFIINSSEGNKQGLAIGMLNISENSLIPIKDKLQYQLPPGKLFCVGRNYWNDSDKPNVTSYQAQDPVTVTYVSSWGQVLRQSTDFDFSQYESISAQELRSISGDDASVQHVYLSAQGQVAVQYGQRLKPSLPNAIQYGLSDPFVKSSTLSGFIKIATIYARGDADDVTDINQVRIIPTGRFGIDTKFPNLE